MVNWTLKEAIDLARDLNSCAGATGWHFGITGSVLFKGSSEKDLDLIAYPRNSKDCDRSDLRALLSLCGMRLRMDVKELQSHWKSGDKKHVEVWQTGNGKRIDLFILGDKPGWLGTK